MSRLIVADNELLQDWGRHLYAAFHFKHMPYHVGSSLFKGDYRDVDVRVMMPDETFAQFDELLNVQRLNLALSLWGQKATGLPIDCQIQSITEGNGEHGGKPRSALGLDMDRHRYNEWTIRSMVADAGDGSEG